MTSRFPARSCPVLEHRCRCRSAAAQNSTDALDKPSDGRHHHKHSTKRCVDPLNPQPFCVRGEGWLQPLRRPRAVERQPLARPLDTAGNLCARPTPRKRSASSSGPLSPPQSLRYRRVAFTRPEEVVRHGVDFRAGETGDRGGQRLGQYPGRLDPRPLGAAEQLGRTGWTSSSRPATRR